MDIKAKEKDYLTAYRSLNAEGRLNLMINNYSTFPKIIRKMEVKTRYRIKSEKEYMRSHSRGELGVRVQSSKLSDPTFEEASTNIMLDKAMETGEAEGGLLNGIENAERYEADIRIISIMRMDYELLSEIVEDLDEDESCWMKDFLTKRKLLKEIASERGLSYETIKRRAYELRNDIREEIIECLEMNCRGGM